MSAFKTTLFVTPDKDGRTWTVVHHSFDFECDDGTLISVPVGTETDFASIPEALWEIYPPWGIYGPGSVIHDFLYTTQPFSKERADSIFLEAMICSGVGEFTRSVIYEAVKKFGFEAWEMHAAALKEKMTK